MDSLKAIFEDKQVYDDRTPLLEWTIAGGYSQEEGDVSTFALFAPKGTIWVQLLALVLLQTVIQVIFGLFVYKVILPRRGSTEAYLLGFGVILPLSLYSPFWILETFDLRNKVLKLATTTITAVVGFKTVECIYDCMPKYVEDSLKNFLFYYSTVVPLEWDDKTRTVKKSTVSDILYFQGRILFHFAGLSLILSFLLHHNFRPLPTTVNLEEWNISWELLSTNHLINAYCCAVLVYFQLWIGFEGTAFGEVVKGSATRPIFSNPLLTATSPTDFWTMKWNTMIHTILKRGAFLPAKKIFNSTKVAIAWTFVMSGLFHDFVHMAVFYESRNILSEMEARGEDPSCDAHDHCYQHAFGRLTAFFAYTGIIMLLERPLGRTAPFRWMAKSLPAPIKATLLVLLHLPLAHWYYGDWIMGRYFHDFSIGLFYIRKL